jgi:hypothetical protein
MDAANKSYVAMLFKLDPETVQDVSVLEFVA